MKQQKPILHARDHMPGGADPLPPMEWIRLNFTGATQTIGPDDVGHDVFFDEAVMPELDPSDPAPDLSALTFGTVPGNPPVSGALRATILRPGVYCFTFRLYLDDVPPTPGFYTWMSGIDKDGWFYYENFHYQPRGGVHGSYIFRSGPEFDESPPELYVTVVNPFSSTGNVAIAATGANTTGSYLEVVRLGAYLPLPVVVPP